MSEAKKNLWDLVKDLNNGKKGLIHQDDEWERLYAPFVVNLVLSRHIDALFHVNELNERPNMSKKMHYDYLMHSLPKRNRFAPGSKKIKPDENVRLVMDVYSYSETKARQVVALLTKEELNELKKSQFTGGFHKTGKV